jgi:hypothetical protein
MSEPLNYSIEIHDSVLTCVDTQGDRIRLSLEAYIHKSKGVPGVDPGSVWTQNVVLTIENASVERPPEKLPWDLTDGTLQIDHKLMRNMIPIPLDCHSDVICTLQDQQSAEKIIVRGTRISLELLGEAKYIEEFR